MKAQLCPSELCLFVHVVVALLLSVGRLLEARKTPFQRESTKQITAFTVSLLPTEALPWFLWRIVTLKVTHTAAHLGAPVERKAA